MISMLAFAVLGVGYDLSPDSRNYALLSDPEPVVLKPQVAVQPIISAVQTIGIQYYYTPQRVIRFGNGGPKMFLGSCSSGSCR